MRKKQALLVCAACALVALLSLLAYTFTTAEPSYAGHPLSYWVDVLGSSLGPGREMATNAINHIGVAALPFLVKWTQYDPAPWRLTLFNRLARTRFPPALLRLIIDQKALMRPDAAHLAFEILGTRAMPAFDDLCRFMNNTNNPPTSAAAAWALGCLGTNGLPALLAVITNANHHPARRSGALSGIGEMSHLGDAAQTAVLAITNCLTDTNRMVKVVAIDTLGDLKAVPEISVPALASCLRSTNAEFRWHSAIALLQFGPQAASAIPALTNCLADSNRRVREQAAEALHQIDPVTFTNAPAH